MKLEIEIPDKYADKLEEIEKYEPNVRDQIEIELLPQALRLINDTHRQVEQQKQQNAMGGQQVVPDISDDDA